MKKGEFIDAGDLERVITDNHPEKIYNIKVKVINVEAGVSRKVCVPISG